MFLEPVGWALKAEFDPAANLSNSFVSEFTLDEPCIFPTFRVIVSRFVAGSVAVRLRFGFNQADTQASVQFILFPILAAVNLSNLRSFGWGLGAALPDAAGNELSILPPHCEIAVDTIAATDLTVQVFASWLRVA